MRVLRRALRHLILFGPVRWSILEFPHGRATMADDHVFTDYSGVPCGLVVETSSALFVGCMVGLVAMDYPGTLGDRTTLQSTVSHVVSTTAYCVSWCSVAIIAV